MTYFRYEPDEPEGAWVVYHDDGTVTGDPASENDVELFLQDADSFFEEETDRLDAGEMYAAIRIALGPGEVTDGVEPDLPPDDD